MRADFLQLSHLKGRKSRRLQVWTSQCEPIACTSFSASSARRSSRVTMAAVDVDVGGWFGGGARWGDAWSFVDSARGRGEVSWGVWKVLECATEVDEEAF